jgi:NAD(P)-dependent dehydrogenase (short-subunit alcohol dehydrogenase family)
MNLSGKVVLVSGGAVRIGRAICRELAKRGCVVGIHYRNSEQEAALLRNEIESNAGDAFVVQGELASFDGCRMVVDAVRSLAGGVDMLVNNASVFNKQSFVDMSENALRSELEINSFAPIFLCQAFAKQHCGQCETGPSGRIVNLLDRRVAGYEAGALAYILSKKMLAEFTKLAAVELAPDISVNAVAPGPVLPPPGKGDAYVRDLAGTLPLQRRPSVEDVAEAVAYLLAADSITGQTIFVDGGQALL